MSDDSEGCPICDWDGEVAVTHDSAHRYYTHVVEVDGELLHGRTCSMRTKPESDGPLLLRLLSWVRR